MFNWKKKNLMDDEDIISGVCDFWGVEEEYVRERERGKRWKQQ